MIITPQGQQKLAPEDSLSGASVHTLGVRAGGRLKAEAFGRDPQERVSNKSLTWEMTTKLGVSTWEAAGKQARTGAWRSRFGV